jgi:two-component system CheB/CheR fusion protein
MTPFDPEPEKPEESSSTEAAESEATPSAARFPIVGIGASAGGLAAFEAFLSAMPPNEGTGMAFVFVQHLAPDHKSILSELVRRYTHMRVFEVENGMAVQPDCAYIIPPNRDMALLNGALHLLEPASPRGFRLPIDYFFRSLAQDLHERAICIVLSGTGSDGTLGLRAVKSEGGMAMVQDPASTEYDGMPRSAIATGLVDYVLRPSEMPGQLIDYARRAFDKRFRQVISPAAKSDDALKKIFILLRARTGHHFSQYKQNTIMRRVERRLIVHRIERLDEYVHYLQQSRTEVDMLFHDLLIGVTSFFRDPEAFAALEQEAIPRLFAGKPRNSPVRVWVPGCASGEEAYSIAILLQEQVEALKQGFKIQVFASDIDSRAIEHARSGVYSAGIEADVSPQRLARFFARHAESNTYRVHKFIRDALIFSEHDVIRDPPFSKVDLISCRNLLIYMGGELHKKLFPLFHYALGPGGVLFLGTSETVGEFADLFTTLDRRSKLYQRKEGGGGLFRMRADKAAASPAEGLSVPLASTKSRDEGQLSLRQVTERMLLEHYIPSCALVDQRGDILYLHGRTGRYLEPAPGEARLNIAKMAREGLRSALTTALREIGAQEAPAHHAGLRVKSNGNYTLVDLTVQRVPAGLQPAAAPNLYLVVFEQVPAPEPKRPRSTAASAGPEKAGEPPADVAARVATLERELQANEEHLRATNEELETTNEELQSSNEEMQSINEELQSTNEELETSKEELQSVNEELATVNVELQNKVADLSRANNDLSNLLMGTDIGTIFVDHHLRIRRFTPTVTAVINLIQADVGRPVNHIVSNLVNYGRLAEDVQEVLDSLVPKEVEVESKAGAWYLLRIRPYRTMENVIEGGVITFTDITLLRKAQTVLRESVTMRRLAAVVRDANEAITVQDLEGRILAWNPGAERLYGWSEAEALTMSIRQLVPESEREDVLTRLQRPMTAGGAELRRMRRIKKDGSTVEVAVTSSTLVNNTGQPYAVATTEWPII